MIVVDLSVPEGDPAAWRNFWNASPAYTDSGSGGDLEKGIRHQHRHFTDVTPHDVQPTAVLAGERRRILLVDAFRNEILLFDAAALHADNPQSAQLDCRYPIPLRTRPRPPVIPSPAHGGAAEGKPHEAVVTVMNVYDSDFPWPEGAKIDALRIIQLLPKPWPWSETQDKPCVSYGHMLQARLPLGTAPVEADGSAHFVVPAGREIYFQALDEQGRAVQSMRSSTHTFLGEQLSCQGCHEPKHRPLSSRQSSVPLALRRPPSRLTPEVNRGEPVNYWRLVKTVFDAKCAGCHKKEGKGIDFEYWDERQRPIMVNGEMQVPFFTQDSATVFVDGKPRLQPIWNRQEKDWYANRLPQYIRPVAGSLTHCWMPRFSSGGGCSQAVYNPRTHGFTHEYAQVRSIPGLALA